MRQINSELRREIFDRYSSGASISDILGAYSDRELEAATHVATLADREHARRCRLVTWFVACCFVFMAFLSARSLIFDGNIASLIRLIIHSVISICLFRVRLWGFLGAIGWLFARVAINLRHVLGDQLTDADKNLYIADMAFYLVLACLIIVLKRRIFPYYGINGPKNDDAGQPMVLRERCPNTEARNAE